MSGQYHSELTNLDKQIAQLLECKALTELEVKALCQKVLSLSVFLIY
jgi:hypothetical protein